MTKEKITNILAINFGGIGDEIFFLPTLISLKKEYPNSKITVALEPRSKGIKDLTSIIDNVILIDIKGKNKYLEMFKLLFKARRGKFDIVISSGSNCLISVLLSLTGIEKRYGYDTGAMSRFLLTKTVPLNKKQYACAMYHDLVKPLTQNYTELPEIEVEIREKITNSVLIHPGVSKMSIAKGCIKTIDAETWAQVIDLLVANGKKVFLVGGPDDDECIKTIVEKTRTNNYENLYGTTKSLKDLASLISSSEKFLCSDSAPLHIAVALKVKTYAIFGPTNYKTLIPESENVVPILSDDICPLKPCLWEKRPTSCETLECLQILPGSIVATVMKKEENL